MGKGDMYYSSSLSGRIRTQPCGTLLKLRLWEITSRALRLSSSVAGMENRSPTSALSNGVGFLQHKKWETLSTAGGEVVRVVKMIKKAGLDLLTEPSSNLAMLIANDNPPLPPWDTVRASAGSVRLFSCTEPTSTQALASLESGVWCLSVRCPAGEGGSVLLPSP